MDEFYKEEESIVAACLSDEDDPVNANDCSRDYELALKLSQEPDLSVDAQFALELQREFEREAELVSFIL